MTKGKVGVEEENKLQVRTYSADRNKNSLLNTIKGLWKDLPAAHALGFRFAERSIRTRYRQSIFGMLWAFLPPFATALIWIILNKGNVIHFGDVGAPYPLFVITGTMIWSVLVNSILMPLQVMQANRNILVKINFPKESIIVNAFYEILFNAFISFIIIGICLLFYRVEIGLNALFFFPDLFALIIMGMAVGLLLLPFSLLFRDIQFILPTILQLGMYLTPVVYAVQPFKGATKLLDLNPVTPLLTHARASLLHMDNSVSPMKILVISGSAVLLFFIGVLFQRKTMKILIERMGI